MKEISFSKEELERYSRHLIIPEFNIDGQRKLKTSKVLVVGSGGLASPLLLYLAAAGIGTIGIVDFDIVDESNLQRQVLFTTSDVGKSKVEVARERIKALNPHIEVITYNVTLTKNNALDIIKDYDLVADGTDNFPTRYLVNDACVLLDKVNIYASIYRFEGQVSVFNYLNKDGSRGPNYRDLFPEPPPPELVPSCAEGGVLGVLPGILGSMQASEVIKVITGIGNPLNGRLYIFDAASFESRILKVAKNPNNPLSGENPSQTELIDYEQFCGLSVSKESIALELQSITVFGLKKIIESSEDYQIIDVRNPYEYEISNLGGEDPMPQNLIHNYINQISKDKKVIIYCRNGKRSTEVIIELQEKYGFTNLYNLEGGINSWAKNIDKNMPVY